MLVLTMILLLSAASCFDREGRPVGVSPPPTVAPGPDQVSFGVDLYESSDGKVRYRIRAAYMAKYETADSSFVLLSRKTPDDSVVIAELYDPVTGASSTIEADEMRFFEADHRFEARGNVVVTTSTGRVLSTEFLIWSENTRRVLAPGFVRIVSPNEDMQGYGFDADENLDSFSLQRVTGQRYIEDE